MAYLTDIIGPGLLKIPSTSATNLVQKATTAPLDASRLGTTAPKVPTPTSNPAQTDLSIATDSIGGQITNAKDEAAKAAEAAPPPAPAQTTPFQDAMAKYLGISAKLDNKGTRSNEIYSEYNVDAKKQLSTDLENKYLTTQEAWNNKIEERRKNSNGSLLGGMNADITNLEMQRDSQLADVAIQWKVANSDYTGAWEMAQKKIDAEFAPIEQQLNAQRDYIMMMGNDLSESEKMQAQAKIDEKEAQLAFERSKKLKEYEQYLNQQDPKYQAELLAAQKKAANEDGAEPKTAEQGKILTFASRMTDAESILSGADKFGSMLAVGGDLPNWMKTEDRQKFEQAQRNFINAVLRRESGAVISPEEFTNAQQQYFPQRGDSPGVIAQKKQNRNTVINGFYREAGEKRPVAPGDIIESGGKRYKVGDDGVTLTEI